MFCIFFLSQRTMLKTHYLYYFNQVAVVHYKILTLPQNIILWHYAELFNLRQFEGCILIENVLFYLLDGHITLFYNCVVRNLFPEISFCFVRLVIYYILLHILSQYLRWFCKSFQFFFEHLCFQVQNVVTISL